VDERSSEVDERSSEVDERSSEVDERSSEVDERVFEVDERVFEVDERVFELNVLSSNSSHLPYPSSFKQNIGSFWSNRFCDDWGIYQAIALGGVYCLHNINTKHVRLRGFMCLTL
ncbi:hypothetical protein, partial [Nostoc sp.]|uniref:hypothetical protein n=1 Tax=Nostoc sp. TaxID=1180 RepID=UPI003006CB1A